MRKGRLRQHHNASDVEGPEMPSFRHRNSKNTHQPRYSKMFSQHAWRRLPSRTGDMLRITPSSSRYMKGTAREGWRRLQFCHHIPFDVGGSKQASAYVSERPFPTVVAVSLGPQRLVYRPPPLYRMETAVQPLGIEARSDLYSQLIATTARW